METGSHGWNDEMYARHPTPYTGLAGLVEKLRVWKIRSMAQIRPDDRVLEVGCESGNLMARLAPCARLVGVDISEAALRDAAARLRSVGRVAELRACDATEGLPFERGEFSVILCSEMLEHVVEPAKVIASIAALCTPETRIVVTVPDEGLKLRIKGALTALRFMSWLLPGIEPEQSEWHLQSFSRASFLALLRGGLEVERLERVAGLHFVALCRAPRSEG